MAPPRLRATHGIERGEPTLLGFDGAIRSRRSEEIICDLCHRSREVGIVWSALNDRLYFDEGLVLAVQIQPRLDCDRSMSAKPPFGGAMCAQDCVLHLRHTGSI